MQVVAWVADPGYTCNRKSTMKTNSIPFVLTILALSPMAQAVNPAPDGGYPRGNTAEGQSALFSLTTGSYNTAIGFLSLLSNTEGQFNTAVGAGALLSNNNMGSLDGVEGIVNSSQNTAIGAGALFTNTTGPNNTAIGSFALFSNTTFGFNTATGSSSLFANTTGVRNTANGAFALASNTTANSNTATGTYALFSNTEGSFNTASGDSALYSNMTGIGNTAIGASSIQNNNTGAFNTAIGDEVLFNNVNGDNNTGVGTAALSVNTSGFSNTAIGHDALGSNSSGSGNIGVGENAGFNVSTAANVICIGSIGGDNIDNSCYIANVYANIQPVLGTDPDYVTISSNGRLGRSNLNGSSRRFKHDIHPMDKASEVIFALNPVRFRYNKEYDPAEKPSFGLVAEEVAEVDSDLVGRNKKGEPESVRYEQINAMLLNEFLKEHKKVEQLEIAVAQQRNDFEVTIAELKKQINTVAARSEVHDEGIQKVTAR